MSDKRVDAGGRWRNQVVAFRMSPEENRALDMHVKLSGLSKQDYIISRVLQQDVVVNGNPRVFKALRSQLEDVVTELRRLQDQSEMDLLLEQTLYILAVTCEGMMTEPEEEWG
jgi:hypothetical protein